MGIYRRRHEMKRICLLAIALAALGALPATAGAKNVTALKVCGSSGCNEVTDQAVLKPFVEGSDAEPPQTFNAPIGSYYTVTTSYGDPDGTTVGTHSTYWISKPGLMHGQDQSVYDPWWQLSDGQNAVLKTAAAGIDPFSPDLARVLVSGRAVTDPNSYIRLFGYFPPAYRAPPKGSHWVKISVRPAHPNPWLQRAMKLRYQSQRRLLERGGYDTVVLPKAIGKLLVKRASLAVKAGSGGGRTALYAGVGAAGAAAAILLAVARRKRLHQGLS
jgi:hypothetical protein